MKIQSIFLFLTVILLTSCSEKSKKKKDDVSSQGLKIVEYVDNAQDFMNYAGIYIDKLGTPNLMFGVYCMNSVKTTAQEKIKAIENFYDEYTQGESYTLTFEDEVISEENLKNILKKSIDRLNQVDKESKDCPEIILAYGGEKR